MRERVLLTGSAGFIGFHLCKNLLSQGYKVVGIDNINHYYDPKLKNIRLKNIDNFVNKNKLESSYSFFNIDISDGNKLRELFLENDFQIVINLAAQAGVRYSLKNPNAYISSNLVGFSNVIECCREFMIKHLIFASSSSVYGMNTNQPFSENDNTDFPISLYAATKKSNELLAHSYSHLYKIPCTGLRFFTVYGPYGRPDMAYYSFTKSIDEEIPIDVFNNGEMMRDFTYIDDIVIGISEVVKRVPCSITRATTNAEAPFRIFNIGNNNPVSLKRFIEAIENTLSKKAIKNMLPMQKGDVPITYADINNITSEYGFKPTTSIEEGIRKFVEWYLEAKI